jgi:hypothetical protein
VNRSPRLLILLSTDDKDQQVIGSYSHARGDLSEAVRILPSSCSSSRSALVLYGGSVTEVFMALPGDMLGRSFVVRFVGLTARGSMTEDRS